jgi:hypothetical protein
MKASIAPRRKNAGSLEFLPTDEQRSWVEKMAGMRMTQDEICQVIINPETGEHISRPTLAKAFAVELATGRSKLKHKIGLKYHERLDAGDWNAIQAGLRHMFKWKDNVTEVEDSDRLPLDQLIDTLAAQAKALGLHIDLSYKFHDPGRFGGTVEPKLIEGVVKGSEEKKR